MKKLNGLDIYEAKINDKFEGMYTISIVDFPAVEKDFVCFKEQAKEQIKFTIENEDQQNITGVIMLAETPIYRRNGDYEYYLIFSKETIKKMAEKYLKEGLQNNVSLMHNGKLITGINMVEFYIKDSGKGIEPNFLKDIPDGSLLATFHVEDNDLWNEIKNGDILNGFSLEGFFTIEEKMHNNKIKNNSTMSKITKFIKSLMTFSEINSDKGKLYWDNEGEIAVGIEVYTDGENEEKVLADDGEYVLDDERVVVVENGVVTEIREKETEEPETEETVEEVEAEEVPETETIIEEPQPEERDNTQEQIDALKSEIDGLKSEIEALKGRLEEIVQEPAVAPIVEEFEAANKPKETKGNKAAKLLAHLNK